MAIQELLTHPLALAALAAVVAVLAIAGALRRRDGRGGPPDAGAADRRIRARSALADAMRDAYDALHAYVHARPVPDPAPKPGPDASPARPPGSSPGREADLAAAAAALERYRGTLDANRGRLEGQDAVRCASFRDFACNALEARARAEAKKEEAGVLRDPLARQRAEGRGIHKRGFAAVDELERASKRDSEDAKTELSLARAEMHALLERWGGDPEDSARSP